ncbi:thioredoxin domain-containing protein [Pseudonocardia sp.]|uniref:DsbA family protein n=1 Tax=Pseudonocardia sp. TaxID=60912 RepID=UPI0026212CE1|nr:thioredoxin domain-containing protein [Pseudonocardia sp.]
MARGTKPGRRPPVTVRSGPSIGTVIGVVLVVLFAGAVGVGVYLTQRSAGDVVVPPGATASGVVVGPETAPTTLDVYLDFQCPACQAYEQQSGSTIEELVDSGAARVVYHPVAYLDRFSGTEYSTRSSAASGCAAEAGVFPQYLDLLFANQPPEGGDGLTQDTLIALGEQAGAGPDFATCVAEDRYTAWTAALTDEASRAGITSTPTVLADGVEIARTDDALRAAVAG